MKNAAMMVAGLVVAACAGTPPPSGTSDSEPAPAVAAPPASPVDDDLAALGYHGEEAGRRATDAKCPGPADGSELVGRRFDEWHLAGWANTGGASPSLADLRGRVVVVRFWTTGCPFCEETMPALQRLSEELRDQPVTFVGAFHAKPEASEQDLTRPLQAISSWKIGFPLAIDREWRTLRAWWLDGAHRHASSVTFVLGKDGRVVHVHPGPVYFPSDDPAKAEANRDYAALRDAVLTAARK